jgi:hypothetical protein
MSEPQSESDDEFDRELERIHRENPEAVKRMIAWADEELAAGRCEPLETLCARKTSDHVSEDESRLRRADS